MPWTADIPPLPEAIENQLCMRQEAEEAWVAANTLLCAISSWHEWLNLSRIRYSAENDYDIETGDEICFAGEEAISVLCGLGLCDETFSREDPDTDPAHLWPEAPSEGLVPDWYVSKEDPVAERWISVELNYLSHTLQPAANKLCSRLRSNPRRAFKKQIKLSPAEKDLLEAIRSIGPDGDRSQTAILDRLNDQRKVPSSGTTKITLAAMKRHGILVEDDEGQYALPEWG